MERVVEQTDDGSATLFVPQLNEHYHSIKGAQTESQHIYIEAGLRANTQQLAAILEVGFGTGLNALLTLHEAESWNRTIHYTTVEPHPLSWEIVQQLNYTNNPLFEAMHRAPWEERVEINPRFTLYKKKTEIQKAILLMGEATYDVIYFDAFAPDKQPDMWTQELFDQLYVLLKPHGILTTYCAKGEVRRKLQLAGFTVERIPGPPGGKREVLRALK